MEAEGDGSMSGDSLEGDSVEAESSRNWIPLSIALFLVAAVIVAGLVLTGHPKSAPMVTSITAPPDPYAAKLSITNVTMSESGNLAGGKVSYIDGHIANSGSRTVTGIQVQVLFRSYTHEVAQNETVPLKLVRMREPYIDTEPVGAAPIKPGTGNDFRLTFDRLSADWAGGVPEIRILHVEAK